MAGRGAKPRPAEDAWGKMALAAVCSALLAAYLLTMPPGYTFGDGALLSAACASLSPAQPPGYPLYVVTCAPFAWLGGLLSFGPGQGASLASAAAAATTCALLAAMLARMGISSGVAAATAFALGLSHAFWSQAVAQQVHSLQAMLFALALFLADRYSRDGGPGRLVALAATLGLWLSNDWALSLLVLPAVLLWLVPARGRLAGDLGGAVPAKCLGAFLLGLSPYLLVAFGQRIVPTFPIGSPPAGFLGYVMSGGPGSVVFLDQPPRPDEQQLRGLSSVLRLLEGPTYLGGLLAIAGAALLARRWSAWRLAALAWGILSCSYVTAVFLPPFFEAELAAERLAAISLASAVTLSIPMAHALDQALGWVAGKAREKSPGPDWAAGVPYLAFLLPFSALVANHGAVDRSADDVAPMYADLVLGEVDPSSLLLASSTKMDYPLVYDHMLRRREQPTAEVEIAEQYLDRVGPRPTIDQLGEYLGREEKAAAITPFVPFGQRDRQSNGVYFTVGRFGLDELLVLSGEARELIAHAASVRDRANSAHLRAFVDRVTFRYAVVADLLVAGGDGQVPEADASLLGDLSEAPGVRFSKFFVNAQELVQRGDIEGVEALLDEMGDAGDLPLGWQVEALNVRARALARADRLDEAREALKDALAIDPSTSIASVPVALLALYAQEGAFGEYARLRARYPGVDPRLLAGADAQCRSNLGRSCAP